MKTLPFFLLLLVTFGVAGNEKLIALEVPVWFMTQFQGSLMDLFPGSLMISYVVIVCLELITFFSILVGLVKGKKAYLNWGIILAQFTFVALGLGQRLTHKHESAAFLFFYAALTFIAGHFILSEEKK